MVRGGGGDFVGGASTDDYDETDCFDDELLMVNFLVEQKDCCLFVDGEEGRKLLKMNMRRR